MFFTIGRAAHDGFNIGKQPALTGCRRNALVYAYMTGNLTSRRIFYQTVAILCRAEQWRDVKEVINPKKERKTRVVAGRFGIDENRFASACWWLRCVWILLP